MTREELLTKQENMWQALSGEQTMTLTLAVEMLQRCHLSPYQIGVFARSPEAGWFAEL